MTAGKLLSSWPSIAYGNAIRASSLTSGADYQRSGDECSANVRSGEECSEKL